MKDAGWCSATCDGRQTRQLRQPNAVAVEALIVAPHGHPGGWISGVYYVDAPRLPGENAYRGALIVGAIDTKQHGFEPPWGTRAIEPVPGRLVLFPSYVSHATEPTGIDGARISVAFDVVPIR
ncbi:MAG: putative 2OG-Fe(II) oxygenase [Rhizomicrobium sp.]